MRLRGSGFRGLGDKGLGVKGFDKVLGFLGIVWDLLKVKGLGFRIRGVVLNLNPQP